MSERQVAPCGTDAAYQRHKNRGEPVDEPCRAARARYMREWRRSGTVGTDNDRISTMARFRAKTRLTREYPNRYRELVDKELAAMRSETDGASRTAQVGHDTDPRRKSAQGPTPATAIGTQGRP